MTDPIEQQTYHCSINRYPELKDSLLALQDMAILSYEAAGGLLREYKDKWMDISEFCELLDHLRMDHAYLRVPGELWASRGLMRCCRMSQNQYVEWYTLSLYEAWEFTNPTFSVRLPNDARVHMTEDILEHPDDPCRYWALEFYVDNSIEVPSCMRTSSPAFTARVYAELRMDFALVAAKPLTPEYVKKRLDAEADELGLPPSDMEETNNTNQ